MSMIGSRTLRGDSNPRVTGAVVNWIGDSIAPTMQTAPGFGRYSGSVNLTPTDFLAWAHLLSNGRVMYGKAAGVGGQRADQMWPRVDTDALTSGGNFCGITTGTNDATAGHTGITFAADMRKLCAAIVSRGQIPVLSTGVPNLSSGRTLMETYRRFQIAYAAENGWPLVDFYTALVDPATRSYQAAYDNGDGIHPNPAGKRVMGQVLVDALTPYLPPSALPVPINPTAAQSSNLAPNPTFTADANSDGVPDSWTKTGAGTISLVTGDPAIVGNALRLSDSGSSGSTTVSTVITSAVGGHRVAFTGLVKQPGTAQASISATSNGTSPMVLKPLSAWTEAFTTWQRFYLEGICPGSATTITLALLGNSIGGPGLDTSIAQLGLYDLTACGI